MVLTYKNFLVVFTLLITVILLISSTPFFGPVAEGQESTTGYSNTDNYDFLISDQTRATKPTGTGPYTTAFVSDSIPRVNDSAVPARIYYPTSGGGVVAPGGAPYHGIVFAPGAGGQEIHYQSELSTIASWGFIVTIVGTGGPCNQEVVDIQSQVIDYYEVLNANASSIFFNKINASACGASGHSNGGWTAIAGAVADSRFAAVCPLAAAAGPSYDQGQANTANLHVPLQLISGAEDSTYLPSSDAYYSLANPIKSYMKIIGSGHGGPFHLEYLISFYKFWLEGNLEYSTFIYGDELAKDIDNNILTFTSEVGLNPTPTISKTNVLEDENITFTADGSIGTPNPPERVITKYGWDLDLDGVYEWESPATGSTTRNYNQSGEYGVRFKITDNWGLTVSVKFTITIRNLEPTVNAGADRTGDEDMAVEFGITGSSDTESDMASLVYKWDFGDGNTTTWNSIPDTTHYYTMKGVYDVKVSVKDDDEAVGIDTLKVTIKNVIPVANFTADKTVVEIMEEVLFDASLSLDTGSDISGLSFSWSFGDLHTAKGKTASHSYADEGTYTVVLTVTDDDGAEDKKSIDITVKNTAPSCKAMNDLIVYEDELIEFTGSGTDSENDQAGLEYSWNLGVTDPGDTPWSSSPEYEFQYTEAGVYNVILTVRDDNGDIGTDSLNVTVLNVEPTAEFVASKEKTEEDEPIFFNAGKSTDTESDRENLDYSWNFDDGTTVVYGKTAYHTYTDDGIYLVVLTVTDDDGDTGVFSRDIVVSNVEPTATISTSHIEAQIGTQINFSAVEIVDTPSDIAGLQFTWNPGDNIGHGEGKNFSYIYTSTGYYVVRLTVTDDDGGTYSTQLWINIIEKEDEGDNVVPVTTEEGFDLAVIALIAIIAVVWVLIILIAVIVIISKKPKKAKPAAVPDAASVEIVTAEAVQGPVQLDYSDQSTAVPELPEEPHRTGDADSAISDNIVREPQPSMTAVPRETPVLPESGTSAPTKMEAVPEVQDAEVTEDDVEPQPGTEESPSNFDEVEE